MADYCNIYIFVLELLYVNLINNIASNLEVMLFIKIAYELFQ